MIPSTDKSYMNAKSDALEAGQKGWMQAHEARMDARFAAFTAEIEKKFSDMTRWVAGLVLGATALTISVMTFLLVHVLPRLIAAPAVANVAAPPPTVIYVIPPPAAATAPPAPKKQP